MDLTLYIRAIIALIFVIGLIGLVSLIFKRYLISGFSLKPKNGDRLSISEIVPIDAKRKLMLIKRDDVEHLVMIGMHSDLIIEKNITDKKQD